MAGTGNRKSENSRRANRVIQRRTFLLMLVLGVGTFFLLFGKLYQLQIKRHDELQKLAVSQQTRSTVVSASRGTILDRNGNILAISATAETVFLSPLEIQETLDASEKATDEKDKVTWTKDSLAAALAEILDVNEENVRQRMDRTNSQYEVIKLRADEDVANRVRAYINANKVRGVYLVTDSKRYYPYSDLACHIIGFVGNDNIGLYGLEARYEKDLEGQTGLVITAKDNAGNDMLYEYEQYFDPENGHTLVLTLDTTVQYYLEKALADMVYKYDVKEGGMGIILNAKTGAVLGMASYPNYDLNHFADILDPKMAEAVEAEEATLGDMQMKQWWNKAVNEVYEPGSTSKVLTLAAALEEGVVDMNTTFNCVGYINVSTAHIKCSGNHGYQTLAETAAHSCNPAFITYGLRLGNEKYYQYMRNFNLMTGSGIDLDGEATSIFQPEDKFTTLDLACYAFGQNFSVTPISLIAAQASCVNGGYLHTPYVVAQVLDDAGNVIWEHDNTPVRQVISEETSALVCECLETVVATGTGRNAQVAGYRIGGKSGTADKRDATGQTREVIVSFMSFAPVDDPEIIMLIALDSPGTNTGTYPSGGNMVAPSCSQIMSEILPYLGIEPSYSAEELLGADATVPNVVDLPVEEAQRKLQDRGFSSRVVGEGDIITDQTPVGGVIIPGKSVVVLYAGEEKPDTLCTVPSLLGCSPAEANAAATNAGLLVRFAGATGSGSTSVRVMSQSEEPGTELPAGTVITVQLGDTNVLD
ncbi:MAG: PASTA domain-containing protein [Oscillospiraceae bacterium]|nr:PASTA domain-containing protein [Oscillospiraceae bacterium]